MKKIATIMLLSVLVSCGTATQPAQNAPKFEQFAYYKSPENFRVLIFIAPDASLQQIEEHAKKQPNTQGAATVIYYYRDNANLHADAVTLAKNEHIAMEAGFKPNCIAGYWKYPAGQERFIETPYK